MKKMYWIFFLIFLGIGLISQGCKQEELEKKIDPNLKTTLKALKANSRLDQNISIVFKVNEPLTDLHRAVLQRKKIKILANIGHIYTASLPADRIMDLAQMKFVDYIQGSKDFKTNLPDSIKSIPNLKEQQP